MQPASDLCEFFVFLPFFFKLIFFGSGGLFTISKQLTFVVGIFSCFLKIKSVFLQKIHKWRWYAIKWCLLLLNCFFCCCPFPLEFNKHTILRLLTIALDFRHLHCTNTKSLSAKIIAKNVFISCVSHGSKKVLALAPVFSQSIHHRSHFSSQHAKHSDHLISEDLLFFFL